ncbi:hypothetical protein ANN_27900 [Periplaneta americana]|uniref:Uncharacterized protein n=1 Tax=Periplaneta americana TaxID=6978 RepID=A0ABQ8RVK6_PERAM|nr:hypothetical protein ANN_27900 [Periplaneta americana]
MVKILYVKVEKERTESYLNIGSRMTKTGAERQRTYAEKIRTMKTTNIIELRYREKRKSTETNQEQNIRKSNAVIRKQKSRRALKYKFNKELLQESKFYVNDEISRVDSSLKGVSSQRSITTARRRLLYPIRDVHSLFMQKYLNKKVGRSNCASLRPPHVKPYRDIPQYVYAATMRITLIFMRRFQVSCQDLEHLLRLHAKTCQ